jgi:uncharacterized protein YaiI (UPF0178 family)
MRIWVDADACPKAIKEILFRAAQRLYVQLTLVANLPMPIPDSTYISFVQVPSGLDVADHKIIELLEPDDLVVTADIPLADAVVTKGAWAINPRGEFYTEENIRQFLAMRNFMEELRSTGSLSGGPAPFRPCDRQAFANQLDRFLTKQA